MPAALDLTLLHCTGDLRAAMTEGGFRLKLIEDGTLASSEHWYAHLLSINKRLCVLFCHGATRYSLVAIALTPARLRQLKMVFADALQQTLAREKLPSEQLQELAQHWQAIAYARAIEPGVLAHLNEWSRRLRLAIASQGGLLSCPIEQIVYELNRQPLTDSEDTPARRFSLRYGLELDT